jgi:kumamolisin
MDSVELDGSRRSEPEGAKVLGEAGRTETIAITVHLKASSPDIQRSTPRFVASTPAGRRMSRAQLATERVSEYASAREAFQKFAARQGLALHEDLERRCVHLEGSVAPMERAFGTSLHIYHDGYRRFRARSGPLWVPEEIAPWICAVLGFDQRPLLTRRLSNFASVGEGLGLWPTEVANLYGLPAEIDGAGQCVGIIALGGGYLPSDLAIAANKMERPLPLVIDCATGSATNSFSGGDPADQEIALDLQVLAGIVPAARIVVYFAANNTQSLAAAIQQAVSDDVNRPQVLSISWGSAEKFWTDSSRAAVQAALADAVRLKVSVVAAAGDLLATAGIGDGAAHVLFPASSPFVLACGGTRMVLADDGSTLKDETVWNDGFTGTGGGISDIFETPDYQQNILLPKSFNDGRRGRGVPDVSAAAAQNPGYRIVVGGQTVMKDGTSAAAPLWAALIAIANAKRGQPVGYLHSFLYQTSSLCRPIVDGNNRSNGVGYEAGPGWNACTGFGVPRGLETVNALAAMP